jgi:phage I-like protein
MIMREVNQERTGSVSKEVAELMPSTVMSEAPEWIELIPAGEFRGRDGRGPYRLNDPEGVIEATRAMQMDAGQPIDYDHATDLGAPAGRPAPAAGWIKELGVRAGALWGRVEWTRHGAAALATREYRYVSPVFEHDEKGAVVRLVRAALTNNPNLYLKAIAAREGGAEDESGARDGRELQRGERRALCAILGLAAETSGTELIGAVRDLIEAPHEAASKGDDRARYVSISHYERAATELNTLRAERAREQAESAVSEAMRAGKIVPAQREWAVDYCCADHDGFARFVARQPALTLSELGLAKRPVRITASGSEGATQSSDGGELSANEIAICARLGIRPADYAKRKGGCGEFSGNIF